MVMNISYFHVQQDVPEQKLPDTAVVIDVLRATTTIAFALNNGAESVRTFADLDDLRKAASDSSSKFSLLLGERGGKKIEDFDLGNSPVRVTEELVSGKRLFMSTTNGTRSLSRVREVKNLYTMALVNRSAVGLKLIKELPEDLWIIGSGWEGAYSLEDSLAAGALVSFLLEENSNLVNLENDEVVAAFALWNHWKNDLEGCLRKATHGKRLISIGNHDEDFRFCSQIDVLNVLPTQGQMGVLYAG